MCHQPCTTVEYKIKLTLLFDDSSTPLYPPPKNKRARTYMQGQMNNSASHISRQKSTYYTTGLQPSPKTKTPHCICTYPSQPMDCKNGCFLSLAQRHIRVCALPEGSECMYKLVIAGRSQQRESTPGRKRENADAEHKQMFCVNIHSQLFTSVSRHQHRLTLHVSLPVELCEEVVERVRRDDIGSIKAHGLVGQCPHSSHRIPQVAASLSSGERAHPQSIASFPLEREKVGNGWLNIMC